MKSKREEADLGCGLGISFDESERPTGLPPASVKVSLWLELGATTGILPMCQELSWQLVSKAGSGKWMATSSEILLVSY